MTRPDSSARPIRSSVGPLRPTAYSTHGGSRSSAAPPTAHSVGHDGLGNRKTKIDAVSGLHTAYYYDVELNPADPNHWDPNFATKNNRLVSYEVRSGSATGTLLRTVEYTYYKTGDASNISVKDEYVNPTVTPGDPCDYGWWYDLALYPYTNGTVAIIANGRFKTDANGEPNSSTYQRTAAREYAYDDPRARWLARELDPCSLAPATVQSWTDYLGVMPWSDFDVELNGSQPVASEKRRYLSTAAEQDSAGTRYLHGDLIDSTVMTTNGSGAPVSTLAYSAFGEPIGDANALQTRYRYAGGWGYESGFVALAGANPNLAPITLQHVGARWYEPAIARFVQRDPIGLYGGINTYAYSLNRPLDFVDPTGMAVYRDPTYGLPGTFWRWAHRQPGFRDLTVDGIIPEADAIELYQRWIQAGRPDSRAPRHRQSGPRPPRTRGPRGPRGGGAGAGGAMAIVITIDVLLYLDSLNCVDMVTIGVEG